MHIGHTVRPAGHRSNITASSIIITGQRELITITVLFDRDPFAKLNTACQIKGFKFAAYPPDDIRSFVGHRVSRAGQWGKRVSR